jgi:cyclic pyranopterin phosphate synthase
MSVCMAVNRSYAAPSTVLHADDELALIPPLSGGEQARSRDGAPRSVHVEVTEQPLVTAALRPLITHPGAGAVVVFEGVTREVEHLHYESYVEMAEQLMRTILEDCLSEHSLLGAAAQHRTGEVPLGEPGVIVAVSARHRPEAFAGARAAIDRIKAELPIWKREQDGSAPGRWVQGTPAPLPQGSAGESSPAPVLTHLAHDGSARMVDVGAKPISARRALARARVRMSPRAARAVQDGDGPKGEVLGVARLAGIQAAKQTALLIPLAHPLALSFVDVRAYVEVDEGLVELLAEARTSAQTGVEMEAMTACAVAALTVYDMVKGLERDITLEQVVLLEKQGGRSDYSRAWE